MANNKKNILNLLFVIGTRPEALKLVPVIRKFQELDEHFNVIVCVTGQHREMLDQVLSFFDITPDHDLNLMGQNQGLADTVVNVISGLQTIISQCRPDILFVQGDTSTAFVGSLSAYYNQVKVAHVEAGLRSFDKYSPFPEELNRVLIGQVADLHFAPTEMARQNLIRENIREDSIYVVGNTAVDVLNLCLELIKDKNEEFRKEFSCLDAKKTMILVTGHRRESFGEPFKSICHALKAIAQKNDVEIVFPVHLNPNVKGPVHEILSGTDNIHLIDPLNYSHLIWLLLNCHFVITDSGGVQEEAPSLGKPVLVMRNVTERIEGIKAGSAKLVGTDRNTIVKEAELLLHNNEAYSKMSRVMNPYGDGKTSERILRIVQEYLKKK